MSEFFMSSSQILRDNLVTELQISNNFLRNSLNNINKQPFYSYKVTIKDHIYNMGNNECQLVDINLKDFIITDERVELLMNN